MVSTLAHATCGENRSVQVHSKAQVLWRPLQHPRGSDESKHEGCTSDKLARSPCCNALLSQALRAAELHSSKSLSNETGCQRPSRGPSLAVELARAQTTPGLPTQPGYSPGVAPAWPAPGRLLPSARSANSPVAFSEEGASRQMDAQHFHWVQRQQEAREALPV